jgi:hypothetical protein
MQFAICNFNFRFSIFDFRFSIFDFRFSIFDFYLIFLLRPISTGLSNTALLSNFTMLLAYCTIACTLAMQPCPAAFPGSLARQPCPSALPGSLARQPCPAALPGSLAWQPCPAALPGSLAEKFASCFTAVGQHACMQYCILLLGRTCERSRVMTEVIFSLV